RAALRQVSLLLAIAGFATFVLVSLFVWLLVREVRLRAAEEHGAENRRRLEALGRMTGGVAHDFNNLLMIIQGSAEGIKRRRTAAEKQLPSAEAILTASQRGRALVNQLLAFARSGAHAPEAFRLQQRADELRGLLQRSIRDNVELSLAVPEGTWPIYADR